MIAIQTPWLKYAGLGVEYHFSSLRMDKEVLCPYWTVDKHRNIICQSGELHKNDATWEHFLWILLLEEAWAIICSQIFVG